MLPSYAGPGSHRLQENHSALHSLLTELGAASSCSMPSSFPSIPPIQSSLSIAAATPPFSSSASSLLLRFLLSSQQVPQLAPLDCTLFECEEIFLPCLHDALTNSTALNTSSLSAALNASLGFLILWFLIAPPQKNFGARDPRMLLNRVLSTVSLQLEYRALPTLVSRISSCCTNVTEGLGHAWILRLLASQRRIARSQGRESLSKDPIQYLLIDQLHWDEEPFLDRPHPLDGLPSTRNGEKVRKVEIFGEQKQNKQTNQNVSDHLTFHEKELRRKDAARRWSRARRIRATPTKIQKRLLMSLDNWTCIYCDDTPRVSMLTLDHVKPIAGGGGKGTTARPLDNLVTCCVSCNRKKGSVEGRAWIEAWVNSRL